jgi:hypothetical protein
MEQRAPKQQRRRAREPEPEPEPKFGIAGDESNFESDTGSVYSSQSDNEGDSFGVTVVSVGGRQYRKQEVCYTRTKALTWDTPEMAATVARGSQPTYSDGLAQSATEQMVENFECPPQLYKHIIGKQGVTKSILEQETGCSITVPSAGEKTDLVTIAGPDAAAMESALNRLQILSIAARQKLPPSHFVSLPLGLSIASQAAFASLCDETRELGSR